MELKQQVAAFLSANPHAITLEIADALQRPEGEILCALPPEYVRLFPASDAQRILAAIAEWGELTTIIEKAGSIFEIKAPFPHGVFGKGYYNLNMQGREGALHGHLKLDNLAQIVFVSLPFRGKASYNIAFIAHNGQTMFKVYLGRDEQRRLFPSQVQQFNTFK